MTEVNLLRSLPSGKRNVKARETAKTEEHIRISREYGEMYFDGPREYGYGGYRYDGRWVPVAKDIVDHFGLRPGDKVLDVGCAKGFLVKDLVALGIDAQGIDISHYAIEHSEPEARGRLQVGSCDDLPFDYGSFDAVLAINTIHNMDRDGCVRAVKEVERLAPGKGFIQVDSYLTPEQKEIFESWVLTARFHDYPDGWLKVFKEAGYTGDWYWTIIR
jgi:cyclopropane fatty-acyl-phospholipid synthase-like methyltransferase